jgi:hypothetical protein
MESTHFRTDSRIENRIGKEKMTLSGNYWKFGACFETADLVKFAKSKPLDFEITDDRNKIQK